MTSGARQQTRLRLDVIVNASPEAVFAAMVDWPGQAEWMLGTAVRVTAGTGTAVGDQLEAVTGIRGVGVVDTMTITAWDPPRRVDVLHTGRVVRGTGTFEVVALPGGRARMVWTEELDLPLGTVGRLGWPLVRPAFVAGVQRSLRAFARMVEEGVLPRQGRAVA